MLSGSSGRAAAADGDSAPSFPVPGSGLSATGSPGFEFVGPSGVTRHASDALALARNKEAVSKKDKELARLRQENMELRRMSATPGLTVMVDDAAGSLSASSPARARRKGSALSDVGEDRSVTLNLPPGVKKQDLHDLSVVQSVLRFNRIAVTGGRGDKSGGGADDDEDGDGDDAGVDSELKSYLATFREVKEKDSGLGETRTARQLWAVALRGVRAMMKLNKTLRVSKRRGTIMDRMATPAVQAALDRIDLYSFNVFDLSEVTGNEPLVLVGMKIMQRHGLPAKFRIDETKLRCFFERIQEGYIATNPYHNAIHGADVMQTFHSFLATGGVGRNLSNRDILAGVLSACVHDYEHPGVNNNFLIATRHEKAILYNDRSVLESHHVAATFRIICTDPKCNIFENLSADEWREVRNSMVDMVLATDNAQHFHHLKEFTTVLKSNGGELNFNELEHRRLIMRIMLHSADISNPAKPASISQDWTRRVMEEFYSQGDRERELKLPISPFMDRYTTSVGKCQRGFIDFLVNPLFKTLTPLLVGGEALLHTIDTNRNYWMSVEDKEAREMAGKGK